MSVNAVLALLSELTANLPAAITTGRQVIELVNDGYRQLSEAAGDHEVTAEEINALVAKIIANSAAIQAID